MYLAERSGARLLSIYITEVYMKINHDAFVDLAEIPEMDERQRNWLRKGSIKSGYYDHEAKKFIVKKRL